MREAMLDDLLAEFSISHLRRTPALALSGGERRRVEIARALASRPHHASTSSGGHRSNRHRRDLRAYLPFAPTYRGLTADHNVRETLRLSIAIFCMTGRSRWMDDHRNRVQYQHNAAFISVKGSAYSLAACAGFADPESGYAFSKQSNPLNPMPNLRFSRLINRFASISQAPMTALGGTGR